MDKNRRMATRSTCRGELYDWEETIAAMYDDLKRKAEMANGLAKTKLERSMAALQERLEAAKAQKHQQELDEIETNTDISRCQKIRMRIRDVIENL